MEYTDVLKLLPLREKNGSHPKSESSPVKTDLFLGYINTERSCMVSIFPKNTAAKLAVYLIKNPKYLHI